MAALSPQPFRGVYRGIAVFGYFRRGVLIRPYAWSTHALRPHSHARAFFLTPEIGSRLNRSLPSVSLFAFSEVRLREAGSNLQNVALCVALKSSLASWIP
jgi:hypothetical protein